MTRRTRRYADGGKVKPNQGVKKFQVGGSTWEVMPSDNTKVNTSVPLQHIQTPDERNKEISGYKPYVDPSNTKFNRVMQQTWESAKVPFQMFGADPNLIKDNPRVGIPQALTSAITAELPLGEMYQGAKQGVKAVGKTLRSESRILSNKYRVDYNGVQLPGKHFGDEVSLPNTKLGEKMGSSKDAFNPYISKNGVTKLLTIDENPIQYETSREAFESYMKNGKPVLSNKRPQGILNSGSSDDIRLTKLWNDMYREHNIMAKGEDNLIGNAARKQVNVPKTDKVPKAKYELNPDGSLKDVGKLRESQLLEPVKGLDFRDDIMNTKNRFGGRLKNTQWTII